MAIFMLSLKTLVIGLAGVLPRLTIARAAPTAAVPSAVPTVTRRMTPAQQWDKVAGVLNTAIGAASNAKQLQAGAAQQLDLATYALYNLFDELSTVISEPLMREAAVVHRLPAKVRRAQDQALAA